MSKSGKTTKKHAKAAARAQAKIEERNKACKRAEAALASLPDSIIAEKLKPTASTVIFKGMSLELANLINQEKDVSKLVFPLNDFYAEIKEPEGHILKIHYVPFEGPASRTDIFHYCRQLMGGIKFAANDNVFATDADVKSQVADGTRTLTPDVLIATVYLEYRGDYSLCFMWHNPECQISCAQGVVSETMGGVCMDLQRLSKEIIKKERAGVEDPAIRCEFLAAKIRLDTINYAKSFVATCVCAIQSAVETYLTGGTLPKLDVKPKKKPEKPNSIPTPRKVPSQPTAKNPSECIAYIHYESESGSLTINKSTKNYSMKWWIVSGHPRHYANGHVVDIQPYIKGEKDDPEAQKALEVFKGGYQKIRTFQMKAKRK